MCKLLINILPPFVSVMLSYTMGK